MRAGAKDFAGLIIEAYLEGKNELVIELHNEAREDYDFYLDCWSNIRSAGIRARLKEIINGKGEP